MTYYTNRQTAPLTFHSFIKYFSLPLGILKTLANLAATQYAAPQAAVGWDTFVSFVDLILLAVAFVGFIRWKGYGWTTFMGHLGLMAVNAVAVVFFYAQYDAVEAALGQLLVTVIYVGLVGFYYIKRQYLFFPEQAPISPVQAEEPEALSLEDEPPAPEISSPPVAYCRHCGQRLLPHSLYCSGCGAEVHEVVSE